MFDNSKCLCNRYACNYISMLLLLSLQWAKADRFMRLALPLVVFMWEEMLLFIVRAVVLISLKAAVVKVVSLRKYLNGLRMCPPITVNSAAVERGPHPCTLGHVEIESVGIIESLWSRPCQLIDWVYAVHNWMSHVWNWSLNQDYKWLREWINI